VGEQEDTVTKQVFWQVRGIVLIAGIVALVTNAGAQAQPTVRQGRAAPVVFANGHVSFTAPTGFSALTAEELAIKYPRSGAPRRAVGNTRRTTTIAYDLLEVPASDTDLEPIRRQLAASFKTALPNLKFMVNELRRVGNRRWAYLEFTSPAEDEDVHNIVLASVYDGRVLLFNFNSTVTEFPRVERGLRESISTITTKR
jgi:hypothetical protein